MLAIRTAVKNTTKLEWVSNVKLLSRRSQVPSVSLAKAELQLGHIGHI